MRRYKTYRAPMLTIKNINIQSVEVALKEIKILKQLLKHLHSIRKDYEYRGANNLERGLCDLLRLMRVGLFRNRIEYSIIDDFHIYRGSDNSKLQMAVEAAEYCYHLTPPPLASKRYYLWSSDIYGWQYRVLFCEGLIEEKTKEVQSRLESCPKWFQWKISLLHNIK